MKVILRSYDKETWPVAAGLWSALVEDALTLAVSLGSLRLFLWNGPSAIQCDLVFCKLKG